VRERSGSTAVVSTAVAMNSLAAIEHATVPKKADNTAKADGSSQQKGEWNLWRHSRKILILDKKSPERRRWNRIIGTYRRFFLGICRKREEEKENEAASVVSEHCL
jgi:hypothetical protein